MNYFVAWWVWCAPGGLKLKPAGGALGRPGGRLHSRGGRRHRGRNQPRGTHRPAVSAGVRGVQGDRVRAYAGAGGRRRSGRSGVRRPGGHAVVRERGAPHGLRNLRALPPRAGQLQQQRVLGRRRARAHYWATGYDWRRCEARLNALPQFTQVCLRLLFAADFSTATLPSAEP